jgi:ATP-dependent DNA helicase RecG
MPITVERITNEQAQRVISTREGQFADVKGLDIKPAKLTNSISAFSNTDGGELYIGISEDTRTKVRKWQGFADQGAANGHIQAFESLSPLGNDYQYDFIRCDGQPGLILHVQVAKTQEIKKASSGIPYIRRGAQNLPVNTPEMLKRLEYTKGLTSFETELVNASIGVGCFDKFDLLAAAALLEGGVPPAVERSEPDSLHGKPSGVSTRRPARVHQKTPAR